MVISSTPVVDPGADRAEVASHVPACGGPAVEDPLDVVGSRRGGEVEVARLQPPHQRVSHRTADQRDLVAGVGESLADRLEDWRGAYELAHSCALHVGKGRLRRHDAPPYEERAGTASLVSIRHVTEPCEPQPVSCR